MKRIDLVVASGTGLDGRDACTYTTAIGTVCEHHAHAHVLLSLDPLAAALLCAAHWAELAGQIHPIDFHAFGSHCNLPGTNWIPSTADTRGTCLLPHDLTEDVERFANQPERAQA